jgi:Transposase DDE domain
MGGLVARVNCAIWVWWKGPSAPRSLMLMRADLGGSTRRSFIRCSAQSLAPTKRFRFKNKLFSLDATVIDLCLSLFDWAKFRQTKGAIKLHVLLDHDGYLPVFAHVTEGASHEITVARQLDFPKGSIVVVDRGYIDYKLFARWTDAGVYFVTRLKDNADFLN